MNNKKQIKEKARFWGRILGKALAELIMVVSVCLALTVTLEFLKHFLGQTIAYAIVYGMILSFFFLSYVWLHYQKAIKKDDDGVDSVFVSPLNMAQFFLNKSTSKDTNDDDKEHLINLASYMYWYWERYEKDDNKPTIKVPATHNDK